MIRAPGFWEADGIAARLLSPLGAVTAVATARRVGRAGWVCPVPVFCCGNATMGGAGKTTLALDLAARLRARGRAAHILTRGYGGRVRGVLRVDPEVHDAACVGDEPLLLAGVAPCWVGADRAAAARAAVASGAEVLVMDDGLQNPGIANRRCALVIDGGFGFGNRRLFPAGPLRERVAEAASRCEVAVLIGEDRQGALAMLPAGLPVLRARLVVEGGAAVAGRRVVGFAGIGRPEKFFDSLTQAGAIVAGTAAFADHHRFSVAELGDLARRAGEAQAVLATTAKDAVRLPESFRACVTVLGVRLDWAQPAAIETWLSRA